MLAFITSLRHPSNAGDYGRVEALLKDTLASVTNQTCDDWVCLIVGQQKPSFELPPQVHWVPVDFVPPAPENGPHPGRQAFVYDKGSKIGIGLIAARAYHPDYVMIIDADDYVSCHLAEFARDHPGRPGWYVDDGWVYSRWRGAYRETTSFWAKCGSCYIVEWAAYEVPDDLDVTASQEEVLAGFGKKFWRIVGAHRDALTYHANQDRYLEPLPFRGAVYVQDTGENHSGTTMPRLARPLTDQMRAEFGIPRHHPQWLVLWRTYHPRHAFQSLVRQKNAFIRWSRGPRQAVRTAWEERAPEPAKALANRLADIIPAPVRTRYRELRQAMRARRAARAKPPTTHVAPTASNSSGDARL